MQQSCMIMSLVPLFIPLRIKEKVSFAWGQKKEIVPGSRCPQRPESDRNNRTWRGLHQWHVLTILIIPSFYSGAWIWVTRSERIAFRADSHKYKKNLIAGTIKLGGKKKCPPSVYRDQYLRGSWKLYRPPRPCSASAYESIYFNASPYYWLTNTLGSLALLLPGSLTTIT